MADNIINSTICGCGGKTCSLSEYPACNPRDMIGLRPLPDKAPTDEKELQAWADRWVESVAKFGAVCSFGNGSWGLYYGARPSLVGAQGDPATAQTAPSWRIETINVGQTSEQEKEDEGLLSQIGGIFAKGKWFFIAAAVAAVAGGTIAALVRRNSRNKAGRIGAPEAAPPPPLEDVNPLDAIAEPAVAAEEAPPLAEPAAPEPVAPAPAPEPAVAQPQPSREFEDWVATADKDIVKIMQRMPKEVQGPIMYGFDARQIYSASHLIIENVTDPGFAEKHMTDAGQLKESGYRMLAGRLLQLVASEMEAERVRDARIAEEKAEITKSVRVDRIISILRAEAQKGPTSRGFDFNSLSETDQGRIARAVFERQQMQRNKGEPVSMEPPFVMSQAKIIWMDMNPGNQGLSSRSADMAPERGRERDARAEGERGLIEPRRPISKPPVPGR